MLNYNLRPLVFVLLIAHACCGVSKGELRTGFYSKTCPAAESIVSDVVETAFSADGQVAPRLLRLFFHDCFVQGCDGSILLENGERKARGNLGVGGFDVIQNAKTQLERKCPGVVSCADIVALAARDAVFLTKGRFFGIPTGRRDGRISSLTLAANLPEVDDSIELLKSKFQKKGLSVKDLVLLSAGAHTIGTTACFFMPTRLYNFTGQGDFDPSINSRFFPKLKAQCPFNGNVNVRLPLDWSSELIFDDHIFRNIRNGFAVLASDARLYEDKNAKELVDTYAAGSSRSKKFLDDFAKAMIKMGNIGVKTGSQGEIRRVCNAIN